VKPSRISFTVLAVWSILRIFILLGDIGTSQMGPMAFADYLFNPAGVHPPNPAGVPGILIDIIVVLEILTIGISWAGRSSAPRKA